MWIPRLADPAGLYHADVAPIQLMESIRFVHPRSLGSCCLKGTISRALSVEHRGPAGHATMDPGRSRSKVIPAVAGPGSLGYRFPGESGRRDQEGRQRGVSGVLSRPRNPCEFARAGWRVRRGTHPEACFYRVEARPRAAFLSDDVGCFRKPGGTSEASMSDQLLSRCTAHCQLSLPCR